VVDDSEPILLGFLMPDAGVALDNLPDGQLTTQHLVSLVKTVKYLSEAQVVHGDICERNVCVSGTC
jgi:RIO-like serine/threonine protein kinase